MIGCSMPNISVIAVFTRASHMFLISELYRLAAGVQCTISTRPAAPMPPHTVTMAYFALRWRLPLFAERTNFQLKGPGTARLLVEQPIGFGDRRRWHQQV